VARTKRTHTPNKTFQRIVEKKEIEFVSTENASRPYAFGAGAGASAGLSAAAFFPLPFFAAGFAAGAAAGFASFFSDIIDHVISSVWGYKS